VSSCPEKLLAPGADAIAAQYVWKFCFSFPSWLVSMMPELHLVSYETSESK
jgi:hypothetical protein